jgi:glucosamine--fructose-6-phosphate aminotransferase (isomerizing)
VERERSSAYTASHLGAMLRLAQLARALGADLGDLEGVPDAVADALDAPGPGVAPPARLLELTGAGPNQWTAAEGALKVRETARVAAEGLAVEQLLHGPAVALGGDDALVCLDGGGPLADRVEAVAGLAEAGGVRVYRVTAPDLGEPLSVFPLTAAVQRIALECAEALGTDPDAFGYDVDGREAAWEAVEL